MTLIFSYGVSGSTTIRLAGFRSRWMMPSAWAACSTSHSWPSSRPTRAGVEPAVAVQQRVERDAADVLHDDARPLRVVERGVVEGDGVGVLEAGHQQRFALEALAELGVGGDVVVHDLDDDLPAEVDLPGQVDAAHAAFAEQADGLVPAQEDTAHHAADSTQPQTRPELTGSVVHKRGLWRPGGGGRIA